MIPSDQSPGHPRPHLIPITSPPDLMAERQARLDAIRDGTATLLRDTITRLYRTGPLGASLAAWLHRNQAELIRLSPEAGRVAPELVRLFGPELRGALLEMLADDVRRSSCPPGQAG